jgi:hypothetical protein
LSVYDTRYCPNGDDDDDLSTTDPKQPSSVVAVGLPVPLVYRNLADLNDAVERMHAASPVNTLCVVVAQGDRTAMLALEERRIRCRWERNERARCADRAANRQHAPFVVPRRWVWSQGDEEALAKATVSAMHGVSFLALK